MAAYVDTLTMLREMQVPKGLIRQPVCKSVLLVHRYSSVLGRTKELMGIRRKYCWQ